MNIRAATQEDAAGVAALEALCFGDDAWTPPMVVSELTGPDRDTLVALEDTALVGYAMTLASGDVVDLLRIAVHPEQRRRGVARTLLDTVIERGARTRAERVLLEVRVGNVAARSFYAASGFAEISRRRGYYRDGSDALVLALPLPAAPASGTE
ncbi:MAG TPA: ribosomal protein S18-alanine N-acetyltransferase [Nocardioidaceae bacterium]|nr:ribosomal protein S18-alanine N-acetyltransferase [Nocardioidaceae bacterium]